ncbi:MAG TPA: Dabb family protein [Vicinamibacterales bacterium]|nr:Dabb family protein [Vicinamibacterales bacterium]
MIVHLVLFSPRPDLSDTERRALVAALERACSDIPRIRRARVGRRRVLGYEYDTLSPVAFEFSAMLEFDSESDLAAYLDHPAHAELGRLFCTSARAAIAHDFEVVDPASAGAVARLAGLDQHRR